MRGEEQSKPGIADLSRDFSGRWRPFLAKQKSIDAASSDAAGSDGQPEKDVYL
jgi:hypothetical protein